MIAGSTHSNVDASNTPNAADALSTTEATSWYLVHCKPKGEECAAYVLRNQLGLRIYLPQVIRHVRGIRRSSFFFPGYLFVQADLGEVKLSSINSAPGVIRLLDFGGGPQRVPAALVQDIQERLDRLNASGGLATHNFKPGEMVRFKSGPWKGAEAIFVGPATPAARVQVLLDLLGRQNELRVEVEDLERVSQSAQHGVQARRGRTTRGRGRRINRA